MVSVFFNFNSRKFKSPLTNIRIVFHNVFFVSCVILGRAKRQLHIKGRIQDLILGGELLIYIWWGVLWKWPFNCNFLQESTKAGEKAAPLLHTPVSANFLHSSAQGSGSRSAVFAWIRLSNFFGFRSGFSPDSGTKKKSAERSLKENLKTMTKWKKMKKATISY